jgi:hypothetical protein
MVTEILFRILGKLDARYELKRNSPSGLPDVSRLLDMVQACVPIST